MPRVKSGIITKKKRRKIFKLAKGYWGAKKNWYKMASLAVDKALTYAYRDRRNKKRDFRRLWIIRINAAVRAFGMTYNSFIHGLKKANININRKVLADIAISDPATFEHLAKKAKESLSST
jgi:large subunit ribosomal protein L20